MQYLITGGALAGSILVIVACCSAVSYAIKRRKQKNLSPTDISIQTKYLVSISSNFFLLSLTTRPNKLEG